mgnify:CR=1 FL=1
MHLPHRWTLPTLTLVLVAGLSLGACSSDSNAGEAGAAAGTEEATVEKVGPEAVLTSEKPIRVARGEPIDITAYAVEGAFTVFDFMSDYCPPCVQISPWMDRLHAEREDVYVVKVDVNRPDVRGIDWRSPVLQQYGIRSIPHFKIYGADGQLMHEGRPAYEKIVGWLEQLPPEKTGK